MQIKERICFRTDEAPKLIRYLEQHDIDFELGEIISSLDILQCNPHWENISRLVKEENLLCQHETLYTKEELQNAEWLYMRSQWKFAYPQPERTFLSEGTTYSKCCSECGSGSVQIGSFRIKNAPNWKKRAFAELHWVGDELFISDSAKEVLCGNQISGISFSPVQDKSGSAVLPDISQLVIQNKLSKGLILDRDSIRTYETCPSCGTTKSVLSGIGMLCFQKNIFENQPDIVKTGDMFGTMHYASRLILVRQKVYNTIVRNKLDRGMIFEPVRLE